jgi:MarR family transcriptional regulator, lower aerobic nicotinate degradation pathway regulator
MPTKAKPKRAPAKTLPGGVQPSEILTRLLKLQNRLMAPFSIHVEKRHKISLNEFRMLMSIGRMGVTASHELVEQTGVNAMGVSRAIGELRRHGRVVVDVDPNNRRRKTIHLTAKGQTLYEQMLPTTEKVADYLFEALRPDEIMAFDHFVGTLTAQLEATDEHGKSQLLERTRPTDK